MLVDRGRISSAAAVPHTVLQLGILVLASLLDAFCSCWLQLEDSISQEVYFHFQFSLFCACSQSQLFPNLVYPPIGFYVKIVLSVLFYYIAQDIILVKIDSTKKKKILKMQWLNFCSLRWVQSDSTGLPFPCDEPTSQAASLWA